jgi:AcrR family transcriptional regulator
MVDLPNPLFATILNMRPRKGDLRKAEIVQAAVQLIATEGVEELTFEALGRKSKMLRAHVAYHFKKQEDIIKAALQLAVLTSQECAVKRMQLAKTPEEQLVASTHGIFDWIEDHPEMVPCFFLMYYYASFNPVYREFHSKFREQGHLRIASALELLRPKLSVTARKALAKKMQNHLTGVLLDYLTTQNTLKLPKLRKETVEAMLAIARE